LISATTEPGYVVLDPFGGSMTSGLVVLQNGCYFVSYELNRIFADMGRKRIQLH
jgi:DNA modification methylase